MLALLGASLAAAPASAQHVTDSFTLPFEAQWGIATLAPGDYSFHLDPASGGPLRLMRGTRTVALIYSHARDARSAEASSLQVYCGNGARIIREMTLAGPGVVLQYGASKVKRGSAQEERQVAVQVPVRAGATRPRRARGAGAGPRPRALSAGYRRNYISLTKQSLIP